MSEHESLSQPLSYRSLPSRKKDDSSPLTLMELSVLRRVDQGQSYREIGAALSRSAGTVQGTVAALCSRFGVPDRTRLLELPRIRAELDR